MSQNPNSRTNNPNTNEETPITPYILTSHPNSIEEESLINVIHEAYVDNSLAEEDDSPSTPEVSKKEKGILVNVSIIEKMPIEK